MLAHSLNTHNNQSRFNPKTGAQMELNQGLPCGWQESKPWNRPRQPPRVLSPRRWITREGTGTQTRLMWEMGVPRGDFTAELSPRPCSGFCSNWKAIGGTERHCEHVPTGTRSAPDRARTRKSNCRQAQPCLEQRGSVLPQKCLRGRWPRRTQEEGSSSHSTRFQHPGWPGISRGRGTIREAGFM